MGHWQITLTVTQPCPTAPFGHLQRSTSVHRTHSHTRLAVVAAAQPPRVAVVGGGVCGLTSTLALLRRLPDAHVTIIAEKVADETTSEGAAGLWKPFALTGTPPDTVNRWGKATFDHYLKIFHSPAAAEAGVFLCPAYEMYAHSVPDPDWASVVPSYRHLSTADLAALDPTQSYTHGFAYDTIIAEGMLYMRYLLKLIEETGRITIERRRLDSLAALSSYDAIINAAGLGARELAPDPAMYAIRGHVLRVKAPWVRYHVEAGQRDDALPAYVIPNNNGIVVLGGTKEKGDEDTVARESDKEEILKRCSEVVPSLAAAEVVASWVGLRPGRAGVRLEVEQRADGPSIVHNYGHGGSGLTLGWGCALEAADMAAAELKR